MADPAIGILDAATSAAPPPPAAPPTAEPPASPPDGSAPPLTETAPLVPEVPESPEKSAPAAGPEVTLKQLRDAAKAFGEANPEQAGAVKRLLDDAARYRAMTEAFTDVDTARGARAALDAAGGVEGIAKLQALAGSIEETDALLEAGDPEVIDHIFEDAPEGAVKLAPHYLNRLEKANPEAFGAALRPHLVRQLQGANFENVIAGLGELVKDNPNAASVIASMRDWWNEQKRLAQQTNEDALRPERDKLKGEWTKLDEEKTKVFRGGVERQVSGHINRELGTRLRPYLEKAPTGMPNVQWERLKRAVAQEAYNGLGKALEKEKDHIETMMRARNRDSEKVTAYVNARVSAVADAVIAQVVKDFGLAPAGTAPGKTKPPELAPPGGGPGKPIRVSQRPRDDEIDWAKDPKQLLFITGKAYLKKNGAFVQWR